MGIVGNGFFVIVMVSEEILHPKLSILITYKIDDSLKIFELFGHHLQIVQKLTFFDTFWLYFEVSSKAYSF